MQADLHTRPPRYEPIDPLWDDEGVLPEHITPDTEFVFSRMADETLRAVGASEGELILDVACGGGRDLASQASSGASLYGVDASIIMIKKASALFRQRGLPLRFACSSAENLPFKGGAFHKVYCKGALDHFYSPSRAMREMARVLRPGGALVVSVANFKSLSCRLGRLYHKLHTVLRGEGLPGPHFWDLPKDHNFGLHRVQLLAFLPDGLQLCLLKGLSLLWGLPHWGRTLELLPHWLSRSLLDVLNVCAGLIPSLSDVILIKARRLR